jgi:dienelactone hydrolase
LPESAFQTIEVGTGRDYYKEKPVPKNIFLLYKNLFLYDKTDLNARIEKRDESQKDWAVEKITFDAPYGNERMISYLFLPVKVSPPFQVLIFFPGAGAVAQENIFLNTGPIALIDFILKNGRAIMIPVYKGTYDRFDGETTNIPSHTHQYTEDLIKWVKDFSRSLDYLETRSDIDTSKIGFIGFSWGGRIGGIIPAIENRLKLSVLIVGGFNFRTSNFPYPEAEELNYVPRIKIPVLMLNGRYDYNFPFETTVKPFYDLLGTPEKDKLLKVYDTDHYVPKSEIIKETIKWLEKYFGPVNYLTEK